MRLARTAKEGCPQWTLMVTTEELADDYQVSCRFCAKPIREGELGYYCPKDKQIACEACKRKDNTYAHTKRFKEAFKQGHGHFFVIIQKEG